MKNIIVIVAFLYSYSLANESAYSDIDAKACTLVEVYEEDMGATVSCGSYGAMEIQVEDDDGRMSITLMRKGLAYPQYYSQAISPAFSLLGSKIEWRYTKGKSLEPTAMIARVTATIEGETMDDTKKVSYLAVSKITATHICVIGKIAPHKHQNILARSLADKATTLPCVIEEEAEEESEENNISVDYQNLNKKGITNQKSYAYFRDMGPLELTLRMLKEPLFPIWRLRLQLFPLFARNAPSTLRGYKVIADRINLSSSLYSTLCYANGEENVEPSLDNTQPSDRHTFIYTIKENSTDFSEEDTKEHTINPDMESCGLQVSCTQTWEDIGGNWGNDSKMTLNKAPWEEDVLIAPAMVRALAKKANWIQKEGSKESWTLHDIPEGLTEQTPWIEVFIENYAGNGGEYLAQWHDMESDESITQTLYQIKYDGNEANLALSSFAVLCAKGQQQDIPLQICPVSH